MGFDTCNQNGFKSMVCIAPACRSYPLHTPRKANCGKKYFLFHSKQPVHSPKLTYHTLPNGGTKQCLISGSMLIWWGVKRDRLPSCQRFSQSQSPSARPCLATETEVGDGKKPAMKTWTHTYYELLLIFCIMGINGQWKNMGEFVSGNITEVWKTHEHSPWM